jgi:DNA-binding NarL/FixJ family response regulator
MNETLHNTAKGFIPKIAIVDNNTLAIIGLKSMLQNLMPTMEIDTFNSYEALEMADMDSFFHYFVAMKIVLENRTAFLERKHKTIVLTTSNDPSTQMSNFKSLCINVPEEQLVKSLLQLEQYGHAGGKNLPKMSQPVKTKILSDREIEVLSLIVQGFINKEIADQLNIGLTTVISHRKNIMDKLGL